MGTNIFAQAATMLRKQSIDDDIDGFVDFMGHCQAGDWIYPSSVHRELRMDVATVYELMESLTSQNYLTPYLQIHCPSCQKYTGYCYKTISEIPSEIFCPNYSYADTCAINHAIVVYRVD